MLENFKWYQEVITFLLNSGRFEVSDLDNIVDIAAYYHSKDYTSQEAADMIHRDYPDFRTTWKDDEEPAATDKDKGLLFLQNNLLSRIQFYY